MIAFTIFYIALNKAAYIKNVEIKAVALTILLQSSTSLIIEILLRDMIIRVKEKQMRRRIMSRVGYTVSLVHRWNAITLPYCRTARSI